MEKFDIHILGCGSATPSVRHFPSAQVVNIREKLFMIDCGEGAQMQMRRNRLNFSRVGHIFISHLHGDHCFGLIGLISTMSLLGRTSDLHIHAPKELFPALDVQLRTFCTGLEYKIEYHPVDTGVYARIYEDRSVAVYTIPLRHRIPCCGYLFREAPPLPHIRRDMIDYLKIPHYAIQSIKEGADWVTADGEVVPNERLTFPSYEPRSYAYCSDTRYSPSIVPYLKDVTLLFHEATFESGQIKRAEETHHSTAAQAATIARECGAGRLLIGHYSARYNSEDELLREARAVFPNTILSYENQVISL